MVVVSAVVGATGRWGAGSGVGAVWCGGCGVVVVVAAVDGVRVARVVAGGAGAGVGGGAVRVWCWCECVACRRAAAWGRALVCRSPGVARCGGRAA